MPTKTTPAKPTETTKLDSSVFGVAPTNFELLKLAYLSYLANGRQNNAVVKTRGLVSGGGKKPWRQKGTGNARVGSIRSPIWRGGGITFGPTGESNYKITLSTVQRRQALRQALSLANQSKIITIADIKAKSGKVSEVNSQLVKLGAKGKILLVVNDKTQELMRSTSNLKEVKIVHDSYLNVFDVLNADSLVISPLSLENIHKRLGKG
ncbi:MAG TPA: 50S ribosomal protein L4 [Candidatus Saccharimonadales bacterium]|jgi:large subunit ribosomal protein L4|nr:50S ribosomal protein L4 [Candidatus Saccharimonadales bacterium]